MKLNSEKVLSISIAAYNVEKTIGKAIESLISDETVLDEIEIIVVNDGSSDRTCEIANRYQEKFPDSIIVIDKENGGYGSTINASLEIASGKYYKLLDGDDWFDKDSFPAFVEFLKNIDADIVISPYYEVRDLSFTLANYHPELSDQTVSLDSIKLQSFMFAMHEIAIKKDMLKAIAHKITEHCFYTDTEYNVMCFLNSNTIARFDRAVYCYRMDVNGQSMSLTGVRKHYKDLICVTHSVIKLFRMRASDCNEMSTAVLKRYVRHIIFSTSCGLMVIEDKGLAKKSLFEYEHMLQSQYPDEYQISNDSGFLKNMRRLHYRPFALARNYAMKKFY